MSFVKILDVYAIPDTTTDDSAAWPKIGVAFLNQDNSINVVLDLFPRVGKIHIRPSVPPSSRPESDSCNLTTRAGNFSSTSRKGYNQGQPL